MLFLSSTWCFKVFLGSRSSVNCRCHKGVCWILLDTSSYLYTTTLCPWAEVRVGSSERSQLTL